MPAGDNSREATGVARATDNREKPSAEVPLEPEPGETSEQRALRVARLQKEVAGGTYKVDGRKLAAKIVDAHLGKQR
ncbi:MAG: flagellar biosynthesis anti-sigma factor FlgM [Bryobacteraceae bacterium]